MDNPKKKLSDVLGYYANKKIVSADTVKAAIALPMIDIGKCRPGEAEPEWEAYLSSHGDDYEHARVFMSHDEFPLLEASYWIEEFGLYVFKLKDQPFEDGSYRVHYEYYLTASQDVLKSNGNLRIGGNNTSPMVVTGTVIVSPNKNQRYTVELMTLHRLGGTYKIDDSTQYDTRVAAHSLIHYGLMTVKFFMDFQNGLDRYPVEVRRKEPKRLMGNPTKIEKKLEVLGANAPKIIFLNQLPEERPSGKDTASVNPNPTPRKLHQRIGHWKTLTHERYAKHPKYGVKNAIRVKPSWVGSVVADYNGHVYRVLLEPR